MNWRRFLGCFLVLVLGLACAHYARAQGTAEYGAATSKAGITASSAKLPKPDVNPPATSGPPPSAHLPIQSGQSVAANFKSLQERAGPDAANLTLESVPDHSQVLVNGLYLGATPVKLTLAPGRYRVEMRGAGVEPVRQEVELTPKQARRVSLTLAPRYPRKISLR